VNILGDSADNPRDPDRATSRRNAAFRALSTSYILEVFVGLIDWNNHFPSTTGQLGFSNLGCWACGDVEGAESFKTSSSYDFLPFSISWRMRSAFTCASRLSKTRACH
jgi:hypothetical protein